MTKPLSTLLLLFFGLTLTYVFLNQPGNAPDEPAHVNYVKYWDKTGEIPVFEKSPYWPRYTAFHPPFHFAVLRLVYPFVRESPVDRQFRALRLASALFHTGAVFFIFLGARRFYDGDWRPALGAACVTALNPMFAFMGAAVNNEALANLAAAAVVWGGMVQVRGATRWSAAVLGLACGVACGAKSSMVIPAFGVLFFLRGRGRMTGRELLTALGLLLLIAGPVFVRNIALYGDPLAASALYKTEPTPGGLAGLPAWFVGSFESYWARFGWLTVSVPRPFYWGLWTLAAAAAAGLVLAVRDGKWNEEGALFLGFFAALVLAQGVWYGVTSLQAQGRYLFIGAAAFSPLLYSGWAACASRLPARARRWAWALLAVFAVALQAASLSRVASAFHTIPGVHNPKGV